MEPWQKDIITRNLPALVELTNWNTTISTTLTSRKILSSNDVDSLDTCYRSTGKMACSRLLYSFLETRTTGFEGIASALHNARQTGAFNILLKECLSHLAEQRTFLLPSPPTSFWMLPRNLVSLEIFDYFVGDLLVFKGIGYDELCSLTKYDLRISGHWYKAGECILLQDGMDFDEICKLAELKGNLHLLEYRRDSGEFLLVRSFGHVFNICQFLQGNDKEQIAIHDFFCTGRFDSSIRLIESNFQMWNSFRDELERKNEESAVGFLGFNFGKIEKSYLSHKTNILGSSSKQLIQALLDCGERKVEEFLSRSQVEKCHLILGILGRVEDELLQLVKDIIHKVCSEIRNMRVWILVRVEVWRVESVFQIKAWSMKGQEYSNNYLPKTTIVSPVVQCELNWLYPALPNANPYFYSDPVVNLLKAGQVVQWGNVAEICGEIFAHCVNILTQWLGTAASSDVQLELMKIGFRSLFPGNLELIRGSGGINSEAHVYFVCEDIAAFAAAKLLVDDDYSSSMESMKLVEFLTSEALQLNEKRRFKNYRFCYFLDHFLGQESGRESYILRIIHKIADGSKYNARFTRRCVVGGFENLLTLFAKVEEPAFQNDNLLMKLAVAFADVSLLKYVRKIIVFPRNMLTLALKRGDISIVNHILGSNYDNFDKVDYSVLLSLCVENSCLDSEPIISQKKNIIDQLLKGRRRQQEASSDISYQRIHLQLFKHLISVGALAVSDITLEGNMMMHHILPYLIPGEIHELVTYLAPIEKMNFFKIIDDNGWTALHHILINFQILPETLDILKANGINFNKISNDGLSPLCCAILGNQRITVIKMLLDCGANRNFKNKFGNGLLHLAAFYGNLSAMIMLLEARCDDIGEINKFAYAPIHLTFISESKGNFIASLSLLLRYGAVADWADASGSTPLFWAVTKCKKDEWLDAVGLLWNRGANFQAKNIDGQNIVHRAASERSPEQYHELIMWILHKSDGSVLKDKCDFKCIPLHYAVLHLELTESTLDILLKYGGINEFDKHGNSVLMYAIRGGRDPRFLKMLMEKGADWRINNCRQFTVLHQAAKYGNVDALELFFKKGCDVNSVTVDGETPLHVAFQEEHDKVNEVVSILLKNKADLTAKDTNGRIPYDLAETRRDYGVGVVAAMKFPVEELKINEVKPKTTAIFKPPRFRFPLSLLPNHGE